MNLRGRHLKILSIDGIKVGILAIFCVLSFLNFETTQGTPKTQIIHLKLTRAISLQLPNKSRCLFFNLNFRFEPKNFKNSLKIMYPKILIATGASSFFIYTSLFQNIAYHSKPLKWITKPDTLKFVVLLATACSWGMKVML